MIDRLICLRAIPRTPSLLWLEELDPRNFPSRLLTRTGADSLKKLEGLADEFFAFLPENLSAGDIKPSCPQFQCAFSLSAANP
jgi:hypothetical protein